MARKALKDSLSPSPDIGRRTALSRLGTASFIALSCLACPNPSGAADRLYYFVDEQGTPHFSNVPADKRYRPYLLVQESPRDDGVAARGDPPPVPAPSDGDDDTVQHEAEPGVESAQPGNEVPADPDTQR